MNTVVSHIDGVKAELRIYAKKIIKRAEALHETYHDPFDEHESDFNVTHGDVDAFANQDHPAALYIELGWVSKTGKVVPGHYTMTLAAHGL